MSGTIEFHLVLHSEVRIARIPAVVWPYLNRLTEWKDSVVSLERIAGSVDEIGETLRIGQRPAEETVYVLQETLGQERHRWRTQSLVTEDGTTTRGYIHYLLLQQEVESSVVICSVTASVRVPEIQSQKAGSLRAFASTANDATQRKLDADHARLKQLVECQ